MCGREEKATEGELIYEGQTNILITDYKIWHSVPLLFLFLVTLGGLAPL